MSTENSVKYEEAKADKIGGAYRFLYLKTLEKDKPGYVADLNYWGTGSVRGVGFELYLRNLLDSGKIDSTFYGALLGSMQDESLRFLTVTAPSELGKGVPQKIWITRKAFDDLTEDEFLSGLCDHEYEHARDGCLGIPVEDRVINYSNIFQLQPYTVLSVKEIRAHLNELEGLVKRDMRKSGVYSNALYGVNLYGEQLLGIRPANNSEASVKRVYLTMLRDRLTPIISTQPQPTV